MTQLLKRKIDKFLLEWKDNPERKPLIVQGARQMGKTESIRAFARANYDLVIEVNFALQKKFRTIFEDGYEVDDIIKNISMLEPSWSFVPHKTLLFLTNSKNVLIVRPRSSHFVKTIVSMSFVLAP